MKDPDLLTKQRRMAGRLGAYKRTTAPGYSGREATRAATEASKAARLRAVDPDNQLDPQERESRARKLLVARLLEGKLRKLGKRRRGRRV